MRPDRIKVAKNKLEEIIEGYEFFLQSESEEETEAWKEYLKGRASVVLCIVQLLLSEINKNKHCE